MIQAIKTYIKKYHEANLWLEQSYVREDKKQALEGITEPEEGLDRVYQPGSIQPQAVFTY